MVFSRLIEPQRVRVAQSTPEVSYSLKPAGCVCPSVLVEPSKVGSQPTAVDLPMGSEFFRPSLSGGVELKSSTTAAKEPGETGSSEVGEVVFA